MKNKIILSIILYLYPIVGAGAADMEINNATIRQAPKNSKITSAYVNIINHTKQNDKLIKVKSDIFPIIELHATQINENAVATMKRKNNIPIHTHQETQLKPAGNHIMIRGIQQQLKIGEIHTLTLVFENAGEIKVPFTVKTIADTLQHKQHNH